MRNILTALGVFQSLVVVTFSIDYGLKEMEEHPCIVCIV